MSTNPRQVPQMAAQGDLEGRDDQRAETAAGEIDGRAFTDAGNRRVPAAPAALSWNIHHRCHPDREFRKSLPRFPVVLSGTGDQA